MEFFELFLRPESWAAIATLTLLEIVLGIDNIVFIAIVVGRLPENKQPLARNLGLSLAVIMRLLLLLVLSWVIGLNKPLFVLFGLGFSGKSLLLLGGGLFLLIKATREIFEKTELLDEETTVKAASTSFALIIMQIILLDLIFSLDSLITAIGMIKQIPLIATAIIIAVLVMLISAKAVSAFINKHPSLKMLALAFLLLIGVLLVAEGTGQHFNKGYIYFAMFFSLFVEILNIRRISNINRKTARI